jgi:hypothetical protein
MDAMYESEATLFLKDLLAKNPELVEQRRQLRATWWNRPQDLQTQRERDAAAVPATSYAYFPRPK